MKMVLVEENDMIFTTIFPTQFRVCDIPGPYGERFLLHFFRTLSCAGARKGALRDGFGR